ncbi:patatin-like phospholipase domain-containing protein 2 isoform C [Alligator mississippiensis]|uniref:Patatin-like phospholipase domain-containing protein 2 isoform C n=1 Tax=Alligator mississippiensis TaxID=8496 RepID=A0A151N687_ALLMI|nr:patatin-like phospholipase domain-containing protein 2 isoform C [Alligator mississippiensis]
MLDYECGWSLSFAGCGFLGVYHIGAATCLQERAPRILRDARRIYGASAGALTGAVLVGGGSLGRNAVSILSGTGTGSGICGWSPTAAESCADVLALAKEARKRNLGPLHPSFNIMKIIRDGLIKNLPENTHQLVSGKLYISLTRVSDGSNVLVSDFNSKEEIIQRYVDGGISDNLPHHASKNTITVSPFSGECDICPKSNSANFHEVNLTNTSIQFSLGNLYRLTQALFPPEPKVLGELCEQGYSDALRFLKENGILNESIYVDLPLLAKRNPQDLIKYPKCTKKKNMPGNNTEEKMANMETFNDQLKQNIWPLDERIVETLPPKLRKALQEACKEKCGFYAQLSKLLPMRVMSYLMLPYTLPVESAYSVAVRVVDWFPDIPHDVRWMRGQVYRIVGTVCSQARNKLLHACSKEGFGSLRKCYAVLPIAELHSTCCYPKIPHSSADLESWLWDFPFCTDLTGKQVSGSKEKLSESDSHLNCFTNSEESGLEMDFDSSSENSFQTASED